MIRLPSNEYRKVIDLFKEIEGADWYIEQLKDPHYGQVYVDNLDTIKSAFIIANVNEFFFGGLYNPIFTNSSLEYILKNIMFFDKEKIGFFYTHNPELIKHLDIRLEPYKDHRYGLYLTRFLYRLNVEKYHELLQIIFPLSPDYFIDFKQTNNELLINIYHQNEIVCTCKDGGQALGILDLDVFTKKEFRRKGLALSACILMINYCLNQKIIPQWGVWSVNSPSLALATKLGFEVISEKKVLFANFNLGNS